MHQEESEITMESSYQQQTLIGATGMELVLALYDGAIRFLYRAVHSIEERDIGSRRRAVSRALDILMYLQARLRTDAGGAVAQSLSDFYAAMFTLTLEASHYESAEQLHEVIACIRNVRDAWAIVARDPGANRVLPRELRTRDELFHAPAPSVALQETSEASTASRWSA
jgi:flagellar secretion chaperone FliS